MMTDDQRQMISKVFAQFASTESQSTTWTDVDECMSLLDWLEDKQLVIEAEVIFDLQSKGIPRCAGDHPIEHCFVPLIIEAVAAIIGLYKETGNLHSKNRFILEMYLTLTRLGEILS